MGKVIINTHSVMVKDRPIIDVTIVNKVVDDTRKTKKILIMFKADFK